MENLMIKELPEISWLVDEPIYRKDKAISYSTLSTFARENIRGLQRVLEGVKLSTGSLRHGSTVDTLLTDEANFSNFYIVSNFNKPSDLVRKIIDYVWEKSDKTKNNLKKLNQEFFLDCIDTIGYGASNWRPQTKIDKITEEGNDYFQLLPLATEGREILHQDDFDYALNCVNTLKTHPYTSWIFSTLNPNMKIYFQLKFKVKFKDFGSNNTLGWKDELIEEDTIRCMFDIILVDYENKKIYPIDLKTTSHFEEDFHLSIQDWYYDLQATMYSYILREVCKQDEYFKDFEVLSFQFLPINKFSLNPQLWDYPASISDIQKSFKDYKNQWHHPWYYYLKEVRWHIENKEFRYRRSTVLNKGKNIIKFT